MIQSLLFALAMGGITTAVLLYLTIRIAADAYFHWKTYGAKPGTVLLIFANCFATFTLLAGICTAHLYITLMHVTGPGN